VTEPQASPSFPTKISLEAMSITIDSVHCFGLSQRVVSVCWSYDTGSEVLSSFHVLSTPAGTVPFDQITNDVLIGWLNAQLPAGEAGIRECIRAQKQRESEAVAMVEASLCAGQSIGDFIRSAARPWDAVISYKLGDVVTHNGKVYRKSDESDNTEPDDVPGGWDWVG